VKQHPNLLDRYAKTLALLECEPFHPSLRLHPLKERFAGLHSVSINIHRDGLRRGFDVLRKLVQGLAAEMTVDVTCVLTFRGDTQNLLKNT
jgi:hypothetical protein